MQTGRLTPTDQRDIPCHLVSYLAYKSGRRRRHGGTSKVMVSSQVTVTWDKAWLCWGWLNHGKWWTPCQLSSFTQLLLYLYNCPFPNPQFLSLSPFWFSPPSYCGKSGMCRAHLLPRAKPRQLLNKMLGSLAKWNTAKWTLKLGRNLL